MTLEYQPSTTNNYKAALFEEIICFCLTGNGAGVHIYVIDTGTLSTHNEFRGRFSDQGYDVFNEEVGKVRHKLVLKTRCYSDNVIFLCYHTCTW